MMRKKTNGDVQIHPLILVIIGAFVAIISFIINATQNSNFSIFIFIGLIMFSYGLVKFIILGKNSQENSFEISQFTSPVSRSPESKSINQPNNFQNQSFAPRFCSRCGLRITSNFNYCPNCGLRFR